MNAKTKAYITNIKNSAKKAYAEEYITYLLDKSHNKQPPNKPDALSYMAAQAVRMTLEQYNS
jgi:hypothetical protein